MKKYRFECWNVAFRKHMDDVLSNKEPFIVIKNPLFCWAADPFILSDNNKYYVFAELYNRLKYKGYIGYCVLDKNGKMIKKWKTALKTKSHLSFPYIYKKDGNYYMMPESSKASNLTIYKAKKFPNEWVLNEMVLENVRVADSIFLDEETILTYDNYSSPRKVLIYKKMNNIWNVCAALDDPNILFRPAGKQFVFDREKIVPLQDSSSGEYGGGFYFGRLVLQNNSPTFERKTNFDLTNCAFINFKKKIIGAHTYNYDCEFEIIDIKTYSFNILSLIGYAFIKIFKNKK